MVDEEIKSIASSPWHASLCIPEFQSRWTSKKVWGCTGDVFQYAKLPWGSLNTVAYTPAVAAARVYCTGTLLSRPTVHSPFTNIQHSKKTTKRRNYAPSPRTGDRGGTTPQIRPGVVALFSRLPILLTPPPLTPIRVPKVDDSCPSGASP